jgi:hypothetical protein
MTPETHATSLPPDRAAFIEAMGAVRADHVVLRDLAVAASSRSEFSADDTLSLADAMLAHEGTEARLFALPFIAGPPEAVVVSATRARQRCLEYVTGNYHLPDPRVAAALFVDALLTHLAVEDAWLDHEVEHMRERQFTIG